MTSPNADARSAEERFLADYDAAQFAHPSVAVDVALVTVDRGSLRALLVSRTEHPHLGALALPGTFVGMDESLEDASARVLRDKAGLEDIFVEQLFTFGAPDRDPRTRVISVTYYALVDAERFAKSGDGVCIVELDPGFEGEGGGPVTVRNDSGEAQPLAFDHEKMLELVVRRLRGKLDYAPIGFELLPREFTLRALQEVHETILGKRLNKDSFRRRMLASGLVHPTGKSEADVGHRPAELYTFRR